MLAHPDQHHADAGVDAGAAAPAPLPCDLDFLSAVPACPTLFAKKGVSSKTGVEVTDYKSKARVMFDPRFYFHMGALANGARDFSDRHRLPPLRCAIRRIVQVAH